MGTTGKVLIAFAAGVILGGIAMPFITNWVAKVNKGGVDKSNSSPSTQP